MTNDEQSILILSGVRGDTRRYRTFHLFEQTRLAGLESDLSHVTDHDLRKKVEQSSIVIIHRACFNRQIAWLETEIHHRGGILIQDIDDLLFEPEAFKYIDSVDFSDPLRASLYKEDMRLYGKTLDACDVAMASTGFLAERVSLIGKPVRVHRNAFSLELLERSESAFKSKQTRIGKFVIGYASGTATHNQDFAQIKTALQSVLRRHSNVELWLVGPLDPGDGWEGLSDRVMRFKHVPWRELPRIQAQFDINLAPIRMDNPFGQSKSEIKYIEAGLLRVPTIASPSDAFKLAIKQEDTGFLAGDCQEWEQYLERLIIQPDLRAFIGEKAYKDVILKDHPYVRAHQLMDTLGILIEQKINPSHPVPVENIPVEGSIINYWDSARAERKPSLLQMGLYTLQNRGFRILLMQIRIYIRRIFAPLVPYRPHNPES